MTTVGWAPDGRTTCRWPDGSGLVPGYRDAPQGFVSITLNLPPELIDTLRERAGRRGTSISEEVRNALAKGAMQ